MCADGCGKGIREGITVAHKVVFVPILPGDVCGNREFVFVGIAQTGTDGLWDMDIAACGIVVVCCVVGGVRVVCTFVIVDEQFFLSPDVGGIAVGGTNTDAVVGLDIEEILKTSGELDAVEVVGVVDMGVVKIASVKFGVTVIEQ